MSLLLRVRLSANGRLFGLQQLNFYSAKSADVTQKALKSTKSRTHKSSESSPDSSQRTNKQSEAATIWPKPREIPYQAKVANFVNLVGHVETPVRSETAADGKHLAAIVISQKNSDRNGSVSIPVVFDGDLAHVVAHHVKQNDLVLVSGRLSENPLKLPLGDSFGKLHVVGEDLNFVEGFKRNVTPKKVEVSFAGVEIENPSPEKIELYERVEEATTKDFSGVTDDSVPGSSIEGSVVLQSWGRVSESKPEQGDAWSGKSVYKKKDEELWRDLVKNPLQWWDYREHKANGLVKDKHPDFKHKGGSDALWADSAPEWVLTEIGKLEFDVKVMRGKQTQGGEGFGDKTGGNSKREDLWKNLVENPGMWWDNRLGKRNSRAPDFKHKETGAAVWLDQLPDWALSRLPPSKDGQTAVNSKVNPQAS